MRILMMGINYWPEETGIGAFSTYRAEYLASRGHEITVCTTFPYYPEWKIREPYSGLLYEKQQINGVTVFRCPLWVPRKPFLTVHPHGTHNPAPVVPASYLQLMRNPLVVVCMLAGVLTGFMEWGQYFWYVSYGTQTQALSPNAARFGMQCFVTGMCVVRCWQAFFHSAWPLGQKLWRLNLLAVLGLGVAVLVPHHGMAVVYGLCNLLFGMGVGVVFPMLLALMIDAAPSQSSKLSALLMMSVTGGAQIAGLLIGSLADGVGVQWAYSTLWLAGLAFTGVIWQLRPPQVKALIFSKAR